MAEVLTLDEARAAVVAAATPLASEHVRLADALGRTLAEDAVSDHDVPPFASSAMDGFAVVAGPARALALVGESRAGHPTADAVGPQTSIAISTGAALPAGADAVVPLERARMSDGTVRIPDTAAGANVRGAGEDVRAGEIVLPAGTVAGPAELAALASLGRATVACRLRPGVSIVVTGDELVAPGEPLGEGQIYDSNAIALAAQARVAGARVAGLRSALDERDATRRALEQALEEADVVCVSGGVSVGPHDHVKPALAALGVDERFWRVALKPGKPVWFGTRGRTLVFGLPGNPVSAMVTFHLFARPAIRRLQGADETDVRTTAILDAPVALNGARTQAIRCRLNAEADGWHAVPTGPQGSHLVTSMVGAHALAVVPPGEGRLEAGTHVTVELLPAAPGGSPLDA